MRIFLKWIIFLIARSRHVIDWLVGWVAGWLAGWLVDWLAGWLVD